MKFIKPQVWRDFGRCTAILTLVEIVITVVEFYVHASLLNFVWIVMSSRSSIVTQSA